MAAQRAGCGIMARGGRRLLAARALLHPQSRVSRPRAVDVGARRAPRRVHTGRPHPGAVTGTRRWGEGGRERDGKKTGVRPRFFGKEAMDSGKQLKAWRNEEIGHNAFKRYPVSGKFVLVIGSQRPWVEAICLSFNAGTITTVDFNKPVSSHPRLRLMTVEELEGTDEVFDVAVSFSSLEHDGLGRYGDPINPFSYLQRI
ncbi:unnamed protein product [Closterium sp. NIES-65]|nr:unnamed protein product [Closterium sp. NIES-65]